MIDARSDGLPEFTPPASSPDAHGQAALLLIESLIHTLIARSVITVSDAIEIVEVAVEVRRDVGADRAETEGALARAMTLLENISQSLRLDLPE